MGGYIARQLAAEFPERRVLSAYCQFLTGRYAVRSKAEKRAVIVPTTFKGLSRHAIARSLHPLNTSNQDMISAIQKMGCSLGFEAFITQSSLSGKVYLLQRYVVQRWLSPVKMMPSVR